MHHLFWIHILWSLRTEREKRSLIHLELLFFKMGVFTLWQTPQTYLLIKMVRGIVIKTNGVLCLHQKG